MCLVARVFSTLDHTLVMSRVTHYCKTRRLSNDVEKGRAMEVGAVAVDEYQLCYRLSSTFWNIVGLASIYACFSHPEKRAAECMQP
jgi:hypothetical protein